jgi:hypothetical protein
MIKKGFKANLYNNINIANTVDMTCFKSIDITKKIILLLYNIFESLLMDNDNTIEIIGHGAFGIIFSDSEKKYIIKFSTHTVNKKLTFSSFSYTNYFKKEVYNKMLVYKAYEKLLNTNILLSPLILIDPGIYGERCIGKTIYCWIVMKRIISKITQTKRSNRQLLYDGEITDNMKNIIEAVAQLYAIHLIGAKLKISNDLELYVGTDNNKNIIVSLIDYGQVEPLFNNDEIIKQSIKNMFKNIPKTKDKYILFKKKFLEIASAYKMKKFGKKILKTISFMR